MLQTSGSVAYRVGVKRVISIPPTSATPVRTDRVELDWEEWRQGSRLQQAQIRLHDQCAGAGVPWGTEQHIPSVQPQVIIHPSARSLLTDRMEAALLRLIPLLESEARRSFVPVTKIEVTGFVDPEEDTDEVVVTVWVKLSPPEALNYWDKLGGSVELWTDYLPADLAEVAEERLAIEVRPELE